MGMGAIARLSNQLFSTTGKMHAAQDAVTLAVLILVAWAYPRILVWVFGAVGVSAAGKKPREVLLRRMDEFVRTDDIAANPEYFILPFVGVLAAGGAVLVAAGVMANPL